MEQGTGVKPQAESKNTEPQIFVSDLRALGIEKIPGLQIQQSIHLAKAALYSLVKGLPNLIPEPTKAIIEKLVDTLERADSESGELIQDLYAKFTEN